MSGSLLPGDDERLRHLHDQVLPWMIGGLHARRQWFVHVARMHSYGSELLTMVAGLGFGGSIIGRLQGNQGNSSGSGHNLLQDMQAAFPGIWLWVGIVAAVLWLALRLIVSQHDVRQRALFAIDCSRAMELFLADLNSALARPDPSGDVANIQRAVNGKVREAISHDVWPWTPPSPKPEDIALELGRQIDHIRRTFMARWTPRDRERPEE